MTSVAHLNTGYKQALFKQIASLYSEGVCNLAKHVCYNAFVKRFLLQKKFMSGRIQNENENGGDFVAF